MKRRQFHALQEKKADYERLLKGFIPTVGERDAKLIRSCLEKASMLRD